MPHHHPQAWLENHQVQPQVGFNGLNAARRLRNPHTAKATKIPLSPASYLVEGPVDSRLQLTHFWEWETIGKP
jgi:hypothetical protein